MRREVSLAGRVEIHLFGSAVVSSSPQDIDLAVVYDPLNIEVDYVLAYRQRLQRDCELELGLPLDACLLTKQEAQSNPFLKEERAILVYG